MSKGSEQQLLIISDAGCQPSQTRISLKKIVIIFVNLCMLRIYELLFYGQIMHVLGPEDEQKNKKLGSACPPPLPLR